MKRITYIAGFLAAVLMAAGALFLKQNWPGGNRILLLGCVALIVSSTAVYIPARKHLRQRTRLARMRLSTGYLAALFIASGTIFKLLYLSPANPQIILGTALLIFGFLPLYFYELYTQNQTLEQKVEERTTALRQEKQKSDDLLLNILPAEVAEELKISGTSVARLFDEVTVLFTDFVNFTIASEVLTPQQLVTELDTCFREFDRIIGKHGIEKIKTVGDAYLAVAGLPTADPNHAENVVRAAMEINEFIHNRISERGDNAFRIRIGIHSGNVVAGIVGVKKFAYDIWGDTVNTAARLEQNSEAGKINISEVTHELVKDKFNCTYRGEIEAKNKGMLKMYFVEEPIANFPG